MSVALHQARKELPVEQQTSRSALGSALWPRLGTRLAGAPTWSGSTSRPCCSRQRSAVCSSDSASRG